jgi:hypothetical protein
LVLSLGQNNAQVSGAKVLAVQGDVKLQDGMEVRTAVPGMSIELDESIVLSESSYVSFVASSGETGEIRERGYYPLQSLVEESTGANEVKTMMYADYVVSRMTPEGKKNRVGATGYHVKSSVRGDETIRLHIPSAGKFYQSQPIISWESDGSKKYKIEVYSMFQDLLFVQETDENYVRLNLGKQTAGDESTLLIKVLSESGESQLYALKRLSDTQSEKIKEELAGMEKLGDGPADKFLLAGIFEYHNLLADALTCYLEAMHEAPDVVAYREAYEEFLLRNHLVRF